MDPLVCLVATCLAVVDGDTLEVGGERVRLWGIDAPELDAPGGAAARTALAELAADGVVCVAPPSGQDRDRWGRAVRLCRTPDGRDLAAALVAAGVATDWPRYSGGFYSQKWQGPVQPLRGPSAADARRTPCHRRRGRRGHF